MTAVSLVQRRLGAVDAAIAAYGVATRDRPLGRSRLETILLANALADVGYLAGGLLWRRRGGDAARGAGAAVVVQGAYLLVSDVAHALVIHRLARDRVPVVPEDDT